MPLVFYEQQEDLAKDFGGYLGPNNWNSKAVLGDDPAVGVNEYTRTPAGIRNIFSNTYSKSVKAGEGGGPKLYLQILAAVNSSDRECGTVFVLKGVHGKSRPRFIIAFESQAFHLHVKPLGRDQSKFVIHSISPGKALHAVADRQAAHNR